MSHEGIRVVPENEARQAEERVPELSPESIDPERVRVNQTEGTGVEIVWKDGHTSHWTFEWLRAACPCAFCIEKRAAEGLRPGQQKPAVKSALPMLKPPVRPRRTKAVGRYAISFEWTDGHTSGIYSWHYLRSICICEECCHSRKDEGDITPSPES